MDQITERLKILVVQEADNIKQFARPEEIRELSFKQFHPTLMAHCIYGQMTGSCYSVRAVELLTLCSNPYSKDVYRHQPPMEAFYFESEMRSFSPIEFYITKDGAKVERLINYIKGFHKTLWPEEL